MTYGLQIFDSVGTKTFDSTTAAGGCVVDMVPLIINSGTGSVYNTGTQTGMQYKTYPDFAGRTAYVILISGYANNTSPVVDYDLGYPRVTFYPFSTAGYSTAYPPEVYMVFVL
jgi:hypothetical protein